MSITTGIRQYYSQHPLRLILLAALFFRIIAAVFSKGYGFSDDHFLVIEVAQQWVDGVDTKLWMPWNGNTTPSGHSLFYPGLHFILFSFLKLIGINDPEFKMLIVRVLHALYSLLIVHYGFKIAKKLGGYELAKPVGWLLALLWFIPMLSVRNSVEMVCIPPLVIATWMAMRAEEQRSLLKLLLAGFIAGIAFSIRFQTATFFAGFGLAFLLQKKWKECFVFAAGNVLAMVLIQGGVDLFIWGRPFAEFQEYTLYNLYHSGEYPNLPWYTFLLLLSGILVPPLSLAIFWGMIKGRKHYFFIILPALVFFIFHSYFPNKQERFIMPVVPFFVIAGLGGWMEFARRSAWWQRHAKLAHGFWVWIWTINMLLLCFLSPASTKISRVEVLNYLRSKGDNQYFALETTHMWGSVLMPLYYGNTWHDEYKITQETSAKQLFDSLRAYHMPLPTYIIFAEPKELDKRVALVKQEVKGLVFEKEIQSSYLDLTMTFLNPVNVNQTYYIYRIEY